MAAEEAVEAAAPVAGAEDDMGYVQALHTTAGVVAMCMEGCCDIVVLGEHGWLGGQHLTPRRAAAMAVAWRLSVRPIRGHNTCKAGGT